MIFINPGHIEWLVTLVTVSSFPYSALSISELDNSIHYNNKTQAAKAFIWLKDRSELATASL